MGIPRAAAAGLWCSAQLLRNIDEAREAAFSSNTSSNSKELLLAVICLIAFDFTKYSAFGCAGSASRLGDFGHVRSYVFTCQQFESALCKNPFVITMRNE